MSEKRKAICMRVKDSYSIIDGSTKEKCTACSEEVYITKTLKDRIKNLEAEIVCNRCMPPIEDIEVVPLNNEQIKELSDHFVNEARKYSGAKDD